MLMVVFNVVMLVTAPTDKKYFFYYYYQDSGELYGIHSCASSTNRVVILVPVYHLEVSADVSAAFHCFNGYLFLFATFAVLCACKYAVYACIYKLLGIIS